MPRKNEPNPLDELATETEKALAKAWKRLTDRTITEEEVIEMIKKWRVMRKIFDRKQEEKEAKK